MKPISKPKNIHIYFDYFNFATYFYTPTKYNKKKIKTLCESLPFFLPDIDQNKIYKLFLKYPVESFYESTERMREYGYLIYMEYHKQENKKYLDYYSYIEKLESSLFKDDILYTKKRVHTILFIILVIMMLFCLYNL